MSYNTRKKLKGTFFILPAFLIHVIVIVIPALSMIYYAFTKWNGLSEPVFIGLDDIKIWRDIIGNCSEVTLDMDAQSALHFVKHVFEV